MKYAVLANILKDYIQTHKVHGKDLCHWDTIHAAFKLYRKKLPSNLHKFFEQFFLDIINASDAEADNTCRSLLISMLDRKTFAKPIFYKAVKNIALTGKPYLAAAAIKLFKKYEDGSLCEALVDRFVETEDSMFRGKILSYLAHFNQCETLKTLLTTLLSKRELEYTYIEALTSEISLNDCPNYLELLWLFADVMEKDVLRLLLGELSVIELTEPILNGLKERLPSYLSLVYDNYWSMHYMQRLIVRYPDLITKALIESIEKLPKLTVELIDFILVLDEYTPGLETLLFKKVLDTDYLVTPSDDYWIEAMATDDIIRWLLNRLRVVKDDDERDKILAMLGHVNTDDPILAQQVFRLALRWERHDYYDYGIHHALFTLTD